MDREETIIESVSYTHLAGKTTTMKMVLGLLQPDQGEILVCNEPVRFGQTKTNQYIGYLPDVPEFYNYMTAMQYLTLCGEIVGLPKESISQKGKKLLSLVGLDGVETVSYTHLGDPAHL